MTQPIAYITDIHLDEAYLSEIGVNPRENWHRILSDIEARGIRSVVFGGDIGEPAANAWFFDTLKDYDLQLTLGNHDTFAEAKKHFNTDEWDGKTEGYYTREDSMFKYLFLDSSTNTISEDQRLWLEKELTSTKSILLFIHHPILSIDTPVDRAYPLEGREELQQILQQHGSPITVFCGHYHMPDKRSDGMIHQYVTPAASYQIKKEAPAIETDNTTFGYRLIMLLEKTVSTEIILFHTK